MKLHVSRLGTRLVVIAECYNPSTLEALDPTVASVTFLRNANNAFVASPLGVVALTKIGGITGVFGAMLNVDGIDTSNLIVVAECTIGGVAMTAVEVLGRSISTGMPTILIEATEKNGDPNYGISK